MEFYFKDIHKHDKSVILRVINLMYSINDDRMKLYVGDDGIYLLRESTTGDYLEISFVGDTIYYSVFDRTFELKTRKTYNWDHIRSILSAL